MSEITIRAAVREDVDAIFGLKVELARHSKMEHLPMLSPRDLERDGFDINPPCYQCLVAEMEVPSTDSTVESRISVRTIGYALYFETYSVWNGRGMLLEDLCISEKLRGRGVGKIFFQELAKICIERNYSRITLECLKWNPAAKFYKKNYGVDVSESEGRHTFKFDHDAMKNLAQL